MSSKTDNYLSNSKKYLQNNNRDIKRPLKMNHSDLSFKGLSLGYKQLEKVYSKNEFLEFADKYVGKMGRELLANITEKHQSQTSKLISVDGDKITIYKKTIPHLVWDNATYIFKILPGDILNGIVEGLGHLPGLKNWSAKTLEKPLFKNIRQRSKLEAKVNSLTGLITYKDLKINSAKEAFAKKAGKTVQEITPEEMAQISSDVEAKMGSSIFQSELKMFDPKTGNYDTKHERSLNRLVSGLPPAIFLANDAYNLSRMMDDDSKSAEKERKIRFKQETSRILTSGYITLITMGAFQKFINKSKAGIVLTTGLTVLATEMFSRLSNGKHITRLTPEEARKENEKMNAPEAKIKPKEHQKQVSSTGTLNNSVKSKEQQKPLLSFDTLMKASAGILAVGYGIKGFKNLPAVKNLALKYFDTMNPEKLKKLGIGEVNKDNAVKTFIDKVVYRPFTNLYKALTSENFHVSPEKFEKVIEKLREYDPKFAQKYEQVGKSVLKTLGDGTQVIDLGQRDRKIKPLVNFVIAPFKFMWNTITLPYWMIDEKLLGVFKKAKPKPSSKDINELAKSFDRIARQALKKNFNKEQFHDFLQVNFLKAFNTDSLSSVSNAELSNLAKTSASIATIWFLMTDNYNMVMLKSNGNDKEGANTKFKERFVQEGSRLFYQTLLIDLFNSTFRNQYNSSLMGMSWITLIDTTLGEMLTRSSVGTPIKAHTRDELIGIETKQNNSTGFKKKYYTFMQRLTGKRSIKSYEVAPRNNTKAPQENQPQIPALTPPDKNVILKGAN
jgi:Cu/Ag efflux protein CusF